MLYQRQVTPERTDVGRKVADIFKAEKYEVMQKQSETHLLHVQQLSNREDILRVLIDRSKNNSIKSNSQKGQ